MNSKGSPLSQRRPSKSLAYLVEKLLKKSVEVKVSGRARRMLSVSLDQCGLRLRVMEEPCLYWSIW